MDPFVYDSTHSGGELYVNLGDISEDILKDSLQFYEQGLIVESHDTTIWGLVPNNRPQYNAFSSGETMREYQDVGYDGLRTVEEQEFLDDYLDAVFLHSGYETYQKELTDPSHDNYHYFKGSDYDEQELGILDRYKFYNNSDGNSPTASQSTEYYQTMGTITPDSEDYNRDTLFNQEENYFQYLIHIKPDSFKIGHNFIDDTISYNARFENETRSWVTWYHFTIPLDSIQRKVGNINDFKNIRYVRIFLRGFEKPIILRFATLTLTSKLDERYIISEQIQEDRIYIYPNPSTGNFKFYHKGDVNFYDFELYDMLGRKIEIEQIADQYFNFIDINLKNIELRGLRESIFFLHYRFNESPFYGCKKILIFKE